MMDLRQTPEYAKFLELEGWTVVRHKKTNYFLKKLPLVGYLLKIQRPKEVDFQFIIQLEKKYRVFQTIIEPAVDSQQSTIISHGYRLSKSPYLPTKTLYIDLNHSLDQIQSQFKRNIKKGIKIGKSLKIKNYSTPDEIKIFREAWKKSVKINRYVPSLQTLLNLKKSFPQKNVLFLASHNIIGRIIGGVIFTITSHDASNYIISYLYGFTSKEGRSSLAHASLLYQGILWGKRLHCRVFDFEGIYDDRFPNKSWLGFTRFKKSFGGYEVLYPGCYTKLRFPFYEKQ